MNKKSLNTFFTLPVFSSMQINQIKNIIQKKITDYYKTIDRIVSKNNITTWYQLHYPLMTIDSELKKIWSPIAHLHSVKHDLKLRSVYEESLLSILKLKNWINHHYGLYQSYKKLRSNNSYHLLNIIQKTALNKILLDYELSGIHLSCNKKKHYKYIISRLSQLSINYSNNVLDATSGWKKLITDKHLLSGIPDNKLKIACLEAQSNQQKGWLFTLQYPSYSSILLYCDNSELREEFHWAFSTRASDQGPNKGKWDNTLIMDEILSLRYELAQILGFNSYFEKSLKKKMVRYPEQVFNFLMNLSSHVRHNVNKEFLEIQNFAQKYYSHTFLKPWDIAYYQEKQKQHFFSVKDMELRSYFPKERVLYGMFRIVNYMYGITIKIRNNVDTWHPDVYFFDIFDAQNHWQGGFYLDLYFRNNKCEGAWMDIYTDMMYKCNTQHQKPIVYLTCNFDPPENSKTPCLLTHDNVVTLFHEFGHVLHHILTSIDIPSISGINGIPEDIAEIPSQFMEKFCWESNTLKLISMHYQTKQSLPDYIINNLLQLKVYQSSSNLLRQVIYGLFDFRIHHEYIPKKNSQVLKIFNEIIKELSVYPIIDNDRFPHSFMHIFSNGYAAGYYSYLWSDMLAIHIWFYCQKLGLLNIKTGKLLLKNILSLNISTDLEQCFTQFCGHAITIKSILQYYDIPVSNDIFFN